MKIIEVYHPSNKLLSCTQVSLFCFTTVSNCMFHLFQVREFSRKHEEEVCKEASASDCRRRRRHEPQRCGNKHKESFSETSGLRSQCDRLENCVFFYVNDSKYFFFFFYSCVHKCVYIERASVIVMSRIYFKGEWMLYILFLKKKEDPV